MLTVDVPAGRISYEDTGGDGPVLVRSLHGLLATSVFIGLVLCAVAKSKRMSDFLEALSDERLTLGGKFRALWGVIGKTER